MTPPTRLYFSMGGFHSGGTELELMPSGEVRIGGTGYQLMKKGHLVEIPAERWEAFWQEIESIGVWDWKPEYSRMILDGTEWELQLTHAGKYIHSVGMNAYPESEGTEEETFDISYPDGGQFHRFLRALRKLTKVRLSF